MADVGGVPPLAFDAQDFVQRLEILRSRDTAEQDGCISGVQSLGQAGGVAAQRVSVPAIARVHRNLRDRPQPVEIDHRTRRTQAKAGHDDLNARVAFRGIGERCSVRQLAAEIQPAHEGEDLADVRTLGRSQPLGQRRASILPQQKAGALPGAMGGREQKDPVARRH